MVSNETPYKIKSSSPFSSFHTHDKVDRRLEAELERHIWHTRDASFFDQFFPTADGLPTPRTVFPPEPQQHAVVDWFKNYDDMCRQWQKDKNQQESRWILKTSPNRPLRHPTSNRKLDLFLYDEELEVADDKVAESSKAASNHRPPKKRQDMGKRQDWKHVIVIAELKCGGGGDLNRKLVLQLADYARYVFLRQPNRQWIHGFTVANTTLRCWLYTRSGALASSPIDLNTGNGIALLSRIFNGYLNMTAEQHGIAASLTTNSTTVGKTTTILGRAFFTTQAIVTRGTTCWTARPLADDSKWPWVLKVSWRYTGRKHEGLLLKDCKDHGVEGVAVYIDHDEGIPPITVHDVLGQECIDAAVGLDLQWHRDKQPSPYSTSATSFRQKVLKVSHTASSSMVAAVRTSSNTSDLATTPSATHNEQEESDLPDISDIPVPDRIYTRVLLELGKPIDEFSSTVELLLAMRDAVRGHKSLLVVGNVLHRDISVNNIMITIPELKRHDGFQGFLLDLDLAITTDALGRHSGAPERTGTFEFMSTRALAQEEGFCHGYYDDLQSFMWVFFWLITRDRRHWLAEWSSSTQWVAEACKIALITEESIFQRKLVRGFDPRLGTAVVHTATALRKSLAKALKDKDLDTELVRDRIYDEVIHAFDDSLALAREEAGTLEPRVVVPRDRMAY